MKTIIVQIVIPTGNQMYFTILSKSHKPLVYKYLKGFQSQNISMGVILLTCNLYYKLYDEFIKTVTLISTKRGAQ